MTCKRSILVTAILFTLLCVTAAVASPPTGQASWTDHARASVVERGTVTVPADTDVSSSSYSLAPGTDTGWRRQPGTSVLAVTKGVLTLQAAEGCTAKEYATGQAAVVPAGEYRVRNNGTEPVEFVGTFTNLAVHGPNPLSGGAGEAAAAGCGGIGPSAIGDLSMIDHARGTLLGEDGFRSYHAHGQAMDSFEAEAGKDVAISSYRIEPGFSSGWHTHPGPVFIVVTRGTFTVYEAHDGKCAVEGKVSPGQAAYYGVPDENHRHLGANEGTEPVEGIGVYFNLPHHPAVPVVGQQADAIDFRPLPPTDCPRLR